MKPSLPSLVHKINYGLLLTWLIFFPLLLFTGLISGAFDGFIKVFRQMKVDVINES